MSSNPPIAIPAADSGWVLWRADQEVARSSSLEKVIGNMVDAIVGYPSSKVSIFPVVMPEVEASLHESMVYSQIEKRGLAGRAAEEGETLFDYSIIDRSEKGITFAVTVVSNFGDLEVPDRVRGFTTAAALQVSPESGGRLWREHGRLVLAFSFQGEPIHLQVLSASDRLDEPLAREINLILLGLRGDPVVGETLPGELEILVEPGSDQDREKFEEALSIGARMIRTPDRVSPSVSDRLLPASVKHSTKSRKLRRQLSFAALVIFAIYTVLISSTWIKAKTTERKINSLERQIGIVEPDVEWIQQADQKWKVLEPAFDKGWFPVVQLSRITSALPGSGVVIREYRTSGRAIRIRGQARDVQLANRLLEDLQSIEEFSEYEWSMGNPQVEKNNTASFQIEGQPRNFENDV